MTGCHSNRFNQYGYLDLLLLNEYAEYANSLCEFLLNTITLDYVVRTSIRNYQALTHQKPSTSDDCISLYNINLDTDFLAFGKTMRQLCAKSKSALYEIKNIRFNHPTWIVRFSPNFKRILRAFACNLRHLVKKISEVEAYVTKADMHGEILRYHAVSAALTTVKYDLLTLYVTIRSGGLTAMKSAFLFPILTDLQRWLTYSYYQMEQILSSFPGSSASRRLARREKSTNKTLCISSFYSMNTRLKRAIERAEKSRDSGEKTKV